MKNEVGNEKLKNFTIVAGIALVISVIAITVNERAIKPMIAKRKASKDKEANKA